MPLSTQPGPAKQVSVRGASTHNLKDIDVDFPREKITVVTGVSGSGKSSLVFDTVLQEAKHRFFSTLSHFGRGFFDMGERTAVRSISGLSLAISLEQNETAPSLRSTVGTLTNLGEILGVLWARFCNQACPIHHHTCASSSSVEEIIAKALRELKGKKVAVIAPIAYNKKGLFKKEIQMARSAGFESIIIGSTPYSLKKTIPTFERTKRYTIKFLYTHITMETGKPTEFAIKAALRLSQGRVELSETLSQDGLLLSTASGCPECGFTWPRLDSRYFSPNSLGKCPSCGGIGTLDSEAIDLQVDGNLYNQNIELCPTCEGTGLDPHYDALTLQKISLRSLYNLELIEVYNFVLSLKKKSYSSLTWQNLAIELCRELEKLLKLGLGHLSLARRITSLSNGERQRLRLSSILIEPLRGVLYILDEPSQGLHPADLDCIWDNILALKELGNTLIIIDHDEFFMQHADHIIDLGPGGGNQGGHVVAAFAPKEAASFAKTSITAKLLIEAKALTAAKAKQKAKTSKSSNSLKSLMTFENISYRYLDIPKLKIKKHALNVVSGVSGVGKTTLVMGVLARNLEMWSQAHSQGKGRKKTSSFANEEWWVRCSKIVGHEELLTCRVIDRKPMAKSSVSMPATYLDCAKFLRELYAKLPASQVAGLTSSHFSLRSDLGRCLFCEGKGYITHSMKFLADAKEECPRCEGSRYQDHILAITYKGYSIADLLSLSIGEVAEIFQHHKYLSKRLQPAVDLGLDYLTFGQPSISLSGGEAQRLKLAYYLAKPHSAQEVFIMDEPTRGLHDQDVKLLLHALRNITALGSTVIIIEHHGEVIKNCDWLIDLGIGPGKDGGKLLYQGSPKDLLRCTPKHSLTAQYVSLDC